MTPTLVLALTACVALLAQADPWWTDSAAGWVGGIGGSTIGLCGALVGILTGLGRARKFILAFVPILIAIGFLVAIVGLAALLLFDQPYAVYYPLLLGGGITCLVFGFNYPMLRRRFQEIELRKIQASDIH